MTVTPLPQCALIVIQRPAYWSPDFYADFTSCVRITYRSHIHSIRDSSLTVLEPESAEIASATAAEYNNNLVQSVRTIDE